MYMYIYIEYRCTITYVMEYLSDSMSVGGDHFAFRYFLRSKIFASRMFHGGFGGEDIGHGGCSGGP